MGNYSYLDEQEGCELNLEKLHELCTERKIDHYSYALEKAKDYDIDLRTELGRILDGWNIQGYWYNDFCKFLVACAESMPGIDKDTDNYINMTEEQGYKFIIEFYLDKSGNPAVKVGYVPMVWEYFKLDKDGNQVEE